MKPLRWTDRRAELVVAARRDDLVVEAADDEMILSDPRTQGTFHLNESARLVWERCDGRTTTRRIARDLVEAYDVDFDRALDDVEQVVTILAEHGLFAPEGPA